MIRPTAPRLIFLAALAIALSFALRTRHAWEDYYITYRSSKNLATGHGLVFNVGDRLHTFTSPLGVLLPAAASLLTLNRSDDAALWIYRGMCSVAFAGAAILLFAFARRLRQPVLAAALPVAWLLTDAKSVDFTINGMETAFLLLFVAYSFWALVHPERRQALHLGAAWAGLMWTRPDGCIYIGLIAVGYWLCGARGETGHNRRTLPLLYLKAGLVTTALYLPWFATAWIYYGTPVPHTVIAKSGIGGPHDLMGFLRSAFTLPWRLSQNYTSLEATFLPAYYMFPPWPAWLLTGARAAAIGAYGLWLLPFLRAETRAASFAYFGLHAYLSYFTYFPFPWYVPGTTLLAFIAYGGIAAQLLDWLRRRGEAVPASRWPRAARTTLLALAAVTLLAGAWTTWQCARLFAAQQTYVEDGNRRRIGEWLRANAGPRDTVFMEPLGYIGFFSGLKTYDFPGMSSREVVEARRKVGNLWSDVIRELSPDWLVLRPHEIERIGQNNPDFLRIVFTPEKVFDVGPQIRALDVNGRKYLEHDATFTVFRRTRPTRFNTEQAEISSEFPTSPRVIEGTQVLLVHAPGSVSIAVPPKAETVTVYFGFPPDAYSDTPEPTDGALFRIDVVDGERRTPLLERYCNPAVEPKDRGLLRFTATLPHARSAKARLVMSTAPGASKSRDWTCWGTPDFK